MTNYLGLIVVVNEHALIDAVAEQAALRVGQVFDAGVARVGAAVEDGDRALWQKLAGGVDDACAEQRMIGKHGGVVDAQAGGLHAVGNDGDHRRFLPRQADVADRVLEEFPDTGARGE